MKEHSKLLIDLLSCAIRGQKPSSSILTEMALQDLNPLWNEIYEEALAHEVHTLIYPILSELPSELRPNNDLMIKWKRETILSASEQVRHIERVSKVLERFHKEGIPVIALKGLVLRNFYPQPELRTMGDADLLVKKEDSKKAKKVLKEMGYLCGESCERHLSFYKSNSPTIELHNDSIHNQSDLRFLPTIQDNTMETFLNDVPVLCLSVDDQILHLLFHSAHHVLSNGFGLRLLCDMIVYIEANQFAVNWEMIFDCTKQFGIYKFTKEILSVCHELFELEIPKLYDYDVVNSDNVDSNLINSNTINSKTTNSDIINTETTNTDTINSETINFNIVNSGSINSDNVDYDSNSELLINDILAGGIYGRRTYDREVSGRFVKYLDANNSELSTSHNNLLKVLFPSIHKLGEYYKYAKKIPLLLPIAWIHRGFHNISRIKMLFLSKDEAVEATSKARTKLLHWLQLR